LTNLFDSIEHLRSGVTGEDRAIFRQRDELNRDLLNAGIEPKAPARAGLGKQLEGLIAEILPEAGAEAALLWEGIGPLNVGATQIGGDAFYAELAAMGIDLGAFVVDEHAQVVAYLASKQLQSKVVVSTLHSQLKGVLVDGLLRGDSTDKIADAIRGVYKQAGGRAVTIARTEIVGAGNNAKFLAEQDQGLQLHGWAHGASRGAPREWHVAIDGEVVKVGEKFSIGLLHPHDWGNGGCDENCNCTCTLYTPTYDPKTGHEFTMDELFGPEKAFNLWKRFGEKIRVPHSFSKEEVSCHDHSGV
jgi:hypothetical protein